MMDGAGPVARVYCCAPEIVWLKDKGCTIVVDQKRMASWRLGGLEAVVWDLVTLGYPFGRIVRLISSLLDMSQDEASGVILSTLARWEEAGMVSRQGGGA